LIALAGVAATVIEVAAVAPMWGPIPRSPVGNANQALSGLKAGLDEFEIDNGRYPTTSEGLGALVKSPGNLPNWKQVIPKVPTDQSGHDYVYRCPGSNGHDYDLLTISPDGQEKAAE
jgi:general secretion pathway protein G